MTFVLIFPLSNLKSGVNQALGLYRLRKRFRKWSVSKCIVFMCKLPWGNWCRCLPGISLTRWGPFAAANTVQLLLHHHVTSPKQLIAVFSKWAAGNKTDNQWQIWQKLSITHAEVAHKQLYVKKYKNIQFTFAVCICSQPRQQTYHKCY